MEQAKHRYWRAPLEHGALREIWRRNRSEDVRALLWEIARLQHIAQRADVILRLTYGRPPDPLGALIEQLRAILSAEPYLQEDHAAKREMLGIKGPRRR